MVKQLEYTKRMTIFGKNLTVLGKTLLFFNCIVTSLFFWFIIFTYYEGYQEVAVLMINVFRMSFMILITGIFVRYFFTSLNALIIKRRMKKINVMLKK